MLVVGRRSSVVGLLVLEFPVQSDAKMRLKRKAQPRQKGKSKRLEEEEKPNERRTGRKGEKLQPVECLLMTETKEASEDKAKRRRRLGNNEREQTNEGEEEADEDIRTHKKEKKDWH